MSDPRYQEMRRIFSKARSLAEPEQKAFLESACAHDPKLKKEIEDLLAHDLGDSESFDPNPRSDHSASSMRQEIRFCTTDDGVKIAYAISGSGPPLIKAANWLNHLEYDWESPVWRHMVRELSEHFTLIRYDERGNGLSDWEVDEISFESFVRDLEAVVDSAGIERFSLLGISQGCPVSIAYAVRHPERVQRLVLHGGYAVGPLSRSEEEKEQRQALLTLARQGWGKENPAFRQVFASFYLPDATREEQEAWSELQRVATPVENALRILETTGKIDVRNLLGKVQAPTLVLHSKGEEPIPVRCAEEIAAGISHARLVTLDTRNHLVMETEPSWPAFITEIKRFLGVEPRAIRTPIVAQHSYGTRKPDSPQDTAAHEETPEIGSNLEAGTRLGHFRIENHIASGGMGEVYRARDENLGRTVAIKILPHSSAAEERRLIRFQREARLLASVRHRNIATIHGLERDRDTWFIVMELADGATLANRLKNGPLPLVEALTICLQISEALAAAHAQNIVHRDLKPANVMLTETGVKVLDFGIAKVASPGSGESDDEEKDLGPLTRTGAILGTGPYMSPEQVRGESIRPATDLWALGCVLFETLVGSSPFERETLAATLIAVIQDEVPRDQIPPATPAEIRLLIQELLEKDPESRPEDGNAVGKALANALETVTRS